jgi:hypothetical protein
LSRLAISGGHLPLKIAAHEKKSFAHHWKFTKAHTGPRLAHSFQPSVCIRLYNKIIQATSISQKKNHENVQVRGTGQGEARIGGGQAYDRSND